MSRPLGQGLEVRILDGCPKEMYMDPMLRTVRDAPDCPMAGKVRADFWWTSFFFFFGGGRIRVFSVRREASK